MSYIPNNSRCIVCLSTTCKLNSNSKALALEKSHFFYNIEHSSNHQWLNHQFKRKSSWKKWKATILIKNIGWNLLQLHELICEGCVGVKNPLNQLEICRLIRFGPFLSEMNCVFTLHVKTPITTKTNAITICLNSILSNFFHFKLIYRFLKKSNDESKIEGKKK